MKKSFVIILFVSILIGFNACGNLFHPSDGSDPSDSEVLPAPGAPIITTAPAEMILTWKVVPGAYSYEVWYAQEDDPSQAEQFTEDADSSDVICIMNGLTKGATYYVWLKARYEDGISNFGEGAGALIPYNVGDVRSFTIGGAALNMQYCSGGSFPVDIDRYGEADPCWAGETEITYEIWKTVYDWATGLPGNSNYYFKNSGSPGSGNQNDRHPVSRISWRAAMLFCNALTEYYNAHNGSDPDLTCVYYSDNEFMTPLRRVKDGSTYYHIDTSSGSYDNPYIRPDATGFRLPGIWEWECAARYTDGVMWSPRNSASGADGPNIHAPYAVYNTNSTAEVKTKLPNTLGCYDMCGNVAEWISTWKDFDSATSKRVIKGGDWSRLYSTSVSVSSGSTDYPYENDDDIGFRVFMNP